MCLEENLFVALGHLLSHHLSYLLTCHRHIKTEAVTQQTSVHDISYRKRFTDRLFGWCWSRCFNVWVPRWLNYFSCNRLQELTKTAEISCAAELIPTQTFSTNGGVLSSDFAAWLYMQLGSWPSSSKSSEISEHRIWAFLYFKSHRNASYLTFLCLCHKQLEWPIIKHSPASHGNEWSTRGGKYSTCLANRLCPPCGSTEQPPPSPRPAKPVPPQTLKTQVSLKSKLQPSLLTSWSKQAASGSFSPPSAPRVAQPALDLGFMQCILWHTSLWRQKGQCFRPPLSHFRGQSLSMAPWSALSFPELSFPPPPPPPCTTFRKHPGLPIREIMFDAVPPNWVICQGNCNGRT